MTPLPPDSPREQLARRGALLDYLEACGPWFKRLARELDELDAAVEASVEERALTTAGNLLGLRGAGALWADVLPDIRERLMSPPDDEGPAPRFDLDGDLGWGSS